MCVIIPLILDVRFADLQPLQLILPTSPAASRPGRDQVLRKLSEGKGLRGAVRASGMQLVWLHQPAAYPMALTVQLQLNLRAKSFVPAVKANRLLRHRRGKREEEEVSVSKHQTQFGHVRWATRRGEGEPNPPRETKKSDANEGQELEDTSLCTKHYYKKKKSTC